MANRQITKIDTKYRLTARELQVLETLWSAGAPLTAQEIFEKSSDETWLLNSVHNLLTNLRKKEAVFESGFVRTEKRVAIQFSPTYSREEYQVSQLQDATKFAEIKTNNIPNIFAALLKGKNFDDKTLDQLEEILKNKRSKT